MINARINHIIETMEIDIGRELLSIRVETCDTMETFLGLHRLKGKTFYKIFHTGNQEVFNLRILLSAYLTTGLRLLFTLRTKFSTNH